MAQAAALEKELGMVGLLWIRSYLSKHSEWVNHIQDISGNFEHFYDKGFLCRSLDWTLLRPSFAESTPNISSPLRNILMLIYIIQYMN